MSEMITGMMVKDAFKKARQSLSDLEQVASEAQRHLAASGDDKVYVHHITALALLDGGGRVICSSTRQRLTQIHYHSIVFVHVCSSTDVCYEKGCQSLPYRPL